MKDEIVIAEALNHEIRIHAAGSTGMVEEARKAQDSAATCTAALGRTLTVTALIASDLKKAEEQKKTDQNLIAEISEQIGSQKSKADYEMTRKRLKNRTIISHFLLVNMEPLTQDETTTS